MVQHCLYCLWVLQQECDLKEAAPLNPYRPSCLFSLSVSVSVFCLCCSCHKTVSLLAFTLSSLSLVGLLLTQWQLEGLHELWVSSDALYLKNAGYWLVISIAQLTCKQSAESAWQYFCMMWTPDPGKKQSLEEEEGFAVWCLQEAEGLKWVFMRRSEKSHKNSNEPLSEQRKNSHQQSCNLRERDRLKHRKQAKFCLSHTCINLILSPPC